MSEPSTPLMRQYHALKQQVPRALLMFRLGDFYELFFEDAVVAARELEITLTARNKEKGEPVPMCGVPYHSADGYIARLIQKGHRVAVCEQMEEASAGKKLVRREITRIVTPGTATEANLLRSHENNFLAAVNRHGGRCGVGLVDVSTGEFRVTEVDETEAAGTLETLGVREVLLAPGSTGATGLTGVCTELDAWIFAPDYGDRLLKEHFQLLSLDGCGFGGRPLAIGAAGALLHYLRDTQRAALEHLERPAWFERSENMILDSVTVRNLELLDPMFAGESRESTLIDVLDLTKTGMGGRLLRRRLLQPAIRETQITERLDAVESLTRDTIVRAGVREALSQVLDLERLLAKTTLGSVNPRELYALGKSLDIVPLVAERLTTITAGALIRLRQQLDPVPPVRDAILAAINEQPPANLADGGTVRAGYHPELDALRHMERNGQQYVAAIEARERQRTGIQSLKVRFNHVFGYYIEISKANLQLAPADYERKQTLVNAERFTTPELKELEVKILEAGEQILTLERGIFESLRQVTAAAAAAIKATAGAVAEVDLTASLAEVAVTRRYTRPRFAQTGEFRVTGGRHPVIERLVERDAQRFIANDTYLDRKQFLAVITGPNMGGKSTYLRQTALISILAQMGSFVPADEALLPIVDRVFTRIGAADNLARGRSTFMVEMTETALILNTATAKSLIILDEIGRGTATYDGLSLAWAILEHIHEHLRAYTLFATHYHELTELAGTLTGIRNLHVSVKESGDQILFLRRVQPGAADRSYGIEVARLAALPARVITRAREILAIHESTEQTATAELAPRSARPAPLQIRLFEPVNHDLAARIRSLKLDELRPIEALQLLAELQKELQ